jgi:hypothetical protein
MVSVGSRCDVAFIVAFSVQSLRHSTTTPTQTPTSLLQCARCKTLPVQITQCREQERAVPRYFLGLSQNPTDCQLHSTNSFLQPLLRTTYASTAGRSKNARKGTREARELLELARQDQRKHKARSQDAMSLAPFFFVLFVKYFWVLPD